MFFRKEKRELLDKMQTCLEGIQKNNAALANAVNGIAENQNQINEGLSAIQDNNLTLAKAVSGLIENENKIAESLSEVQSDNMALTEALDDILESNKTAITDIADSREQIHSVISSVQANNLVLANTLNSIVQTDTTTPELNEKKQYTDEEKWKAAYALNLCTVSISQIIEYNDLRFMDKEYDNILNNLNLELMPKDEALLDVLKQILDVITFFKIQDKERKLLEKEYEQKVKDAIWSAAPNPSVILAGGSGGWVGLAVTAAISIGTGYMNYRKEKAKIGLEQERKEWELERSLMEQLHGLRRQLFETSWRLADEYKFSDNLRLTEKQIKQFNEILQDDDHLRKYYRLEYIKDQYGAYPPFLYYLGSAALNVAKIYEKDAEISKQYLEKANDHFDEFFEKSKIQNKLLREDPVVAQCAFEYIATLELKDDKKLLTIDKNEKKRLIGEKLDSAVKSSGNSLDVLQMCALNYLASDRANEAIRILKMLVNEYYNVTSNAQLLSMLYVKSLSVGQNDAEAEYLLLDRTCPYKIELYPMPANKEKIVFDDLDKSFCTKQRVYLADKYFKAIEAYLNKSECEFNEIWCKDYDISCDIVVFFQKFAQAMEVLRFGSGEKTVKDGLTKTFDQIKKDYDLNEVFSNPALRVEYKFGTFVKDAVVSIITEIVEQLQSAKNYDDISKLGTKVQEFCNKYSLVTEKNVIMNNQTNTDETIESIVTGKSLAQSKIDKQLFEECIKIVKDSRLKDGIVTSNSKKDREVECYYFDSRQFEEYLSNHMSVINSLNGKVLAIIEDKKGVSKIDLVITTRKLYVVSKHWYDYSWNIEYSAKYDEIKIAKKENAIEYNSGHKIYNQDPKGIDYRALGEMLHGLKSVVSKYCAQETVSGTVEAIMLEAKNQCEEAINSILSSAGSGNNVRFLLSPNGVESSQHSINDGYAEITYVTDPPNCVGLTVRVHNGMFSENDDVSIVNEDGTECYGSIISIHSNNQLVSSVKQGDFATFVITGISKNDIHVGASVYHC